MATIGPTRRPVARRMKPKKEQKIETPEGYNFTHAQTRPFEQIDPKTCMWGGVPDVINCANFLKIGQGVSELAYPEKQHFQLKAFFALISVSTTVLHCEDSVILAASHVIQAVIDLCACIAENELNMSFNVKKSAVVRTGHAFRHLCACVNLKGCAIDYVETVRYVGVHIRCGKYFRLSTKESKGAFYRAVNALCSKTKYKLDDVVMSMTMSMSMSVNYLYNAKGRQSNLRRSRVSD